MKILYMLLFLMVLTSCQKPKNISETEINSINIEKPKIDYSKLEIDSYFKSEHSGNYTKYDQPDENEIFKHENLLINFEFMKRLYNENPTVFGEQINILPKNDNFDFTESEESQYVIDPSGISGPDYSDVHTINKSEYIYYSDPRGDFYMDCISLAIAKNDNTFMNNITIRERMKGYFSFYYLRAAIIFNNNEIFDQIMDVGEISNYKLLMLFSTAVNYKNEYAFNKLLTNISMTKEEEVNFLIEAIFTEAEYFQNILFSQIQLNKSIIDYNSFIISYYPFIEMRGEKAINDLSRYLPIDFNNKLYTKTLIKKLIDSGYFDLLHYFLKTNNLKIDVYEYLSDFNKFENLNAISVYLFKNNLILESSYDFLMRYLIQTNSYDAFYYIFPIIKDKIKTNLLFYSIEINSNEIFTKYILKLNPDLFVNRELNKDAVTFSENLKNNLNFKWFKRVPNN